MKRRHPSAGTSSGVTTDIAAMLAAYPSGIHRVPQDAIVRCVQECVNCAQACTMCADASLVGPEPVNRAGLTNAAANCGEVAALAARVVSRGTGRDDRLTTAVLRACVEACRVCHDECRVHALDHEYCRVCGEACRRCARECRALLAFVEAA
jgi:hypothetical protein